MRRYLFALLLVSQLQTAQAADVRMRPGLWEMSATSDLLSLLPNIPPEQLQGLSQMAKEYGLDMPRIEDGAARTKVCITEEMTRRKIPPAFEQTQYGCELTRSSQDGNRYQLEFSCANDRLKGKGSASWSIDDPEHVSGTSRYDGTVDGYQINEQSSNSGHWIAALCGAIKPIPMQ